MLSQNIALLFSPLKLMERYFIQTTFRSSIVVLGVIYAIYIFLRFFDEIDDYDFVLALITSFLVSINIIYDIANPSFFVGVILGLSTMINHNEIVIMRASGLSLLYFIRSITLVAIAFSVLVYFVGEGINPLVQNYLQNLHQSQKSQLTSSGLWLKNDQGIIQISLANNKQLNTIYIYQTDKDKLIKKEKISEAEFNNDNWILKNIESQNFNYQNDELIELKTSTQQNQISKDWLNQSIFDQFEAKISNLSLLKIWTNIQFFAANGVNNNLYWLHFYKRLFAPFNLVAIAIFALLLALFTNKRSQKTGERILIGLVIGLFIYLFSEIISQAVLVYNLNPILSHLTILLLIIVLCLFLLFYQKQTH